MNVLLDSHVAVWWAGSPEELKSDVTSIVANPLNDVWVSAASAWELAIKVAAGRLELDVRRLFAGLADGGLRLLGMGVDDGVEAATLAWSHRDPFDRMLAAQARRLDLQLITRDRALLSFDGVATIAA